MKNEQINKTIYSRRKPVKIVAVFFLFPLYLFAQDAQIEESLNNRIESLKLDSTEVGAKLYYSQGFEERGKLISKQIDSARQFYLDSLGINVRIRVALLDTTDYINASISIPYGLPFVSDGLIILPADNSLGAVKSMFAPFAKTASKEILTELNSIGFSFSDAVNQNVDLIGLHEIGHTQINAYEINTWQLWCEELMASYFSYAFMKAREPKMAVIWDNVGKAVFEGYTPNHTSLDVFNELYVGVGVENYSWFQCAFQARNEAVYPEMGLDFIRLVKEKLNDSSFEPKTAMELLEALEEITPGFIEWADSLQKQ